MIAEVSRPRWLLQVVRATGGGGVFFLHGVAGELLGLEVASARPGGYMDTSASGPDQGVAYLRYELVSRSPRWHPPKYTRMCAKKLCLLFRYRYR